MIAPYTRIADSAERQRLRGKMNYCVVYATAAETYARKYLSFRTLFIRKKIQSERGRAFVDYRKNFFLVTVNDYGENGTENFFLHTRVVLSAGNITVGSIFNRFSLYLPPQ